MYQPYKFIKENPETNIKLKIDYFSLEISKEQKIRQYIAYLLREKNIILSPQKMQSVFNDYVLPDDILKIIETLEPEIERFLNTVTFHDNIRNSYGIYKKMRDYAETRGRYYDKNNQILEIHDGNRLEQSKFIDHYIADNSDEYVLMITDHVSLLTPQRDEGNLHAAINNFSNNHCLALRDRFKYTPIVVQQQVATQEELKFSKGNLIIDSLRPSVDGLADSKYTSKDVNLMFGLFSPHRFKIPQYPLEEGYNINRLKDNYRELNLMLNRDGSGTVNSDLYFNGACSYFKELPNQLNEEQYLRIERLRQSSR